MIRRKKPTFRPILRTSGKNNADSLTASSNSKADDTQNHNSIVHSSANALNTPCAIQASTTTPSKQIESAIDKNKNKTDKQPATVTRRKKMFVAPNVGSASLRFPDKRNGAKESAIKISPTSSIDANLRTDDTLLTSTSEPNSPVKTVSIIGSVEGVNDASASMLVHAAENKASPPDAFVTANGNNSPTSSQANNHPLSPEKCSDRLSSPKSQKNSTVCAPLPTRNILKTKEQLLKEHYGYESKLHRYRSALKKFKTMNFDKPNKDGQDWSSAVRNSLLISDLIYCNPPEGSAKEIGLRAALRKLKEREMEERSEENNSPQEPTRTQSITPSPEESNQTENNVLAPQICLNEDGTIVIDEESLVISTSNSEPIVHNTPAVYENEFSRVNQASFRRFPINKRSHWSAKQTEKFYKALQIVGADFNLMSAMFRNRNDNELRRKYHLEKKKNSRKVDDALKDQHLSKWTDDMFQAFHSDDETDIPKKKRRKKQQNKINSSKANAGTQRT